MESLRRPLLALVLSSSIISSGCQLIPNDFIIGLSKMNIREAPPKQEYVETDKPNYINR